MSILDDLAQWVVHWAHTPYGTIALFFLAFCESSFFPLPPDTLLIALCMARPEESLWYAAICSTGSVLGGSFGYGIGRVGGRPLLVRWVRPERIALVQSAYQRWDVWAVAIAGFTPIPYKVFTISAGVFLLNFWRFLLASLVSRSSRFFLVAMMFYWYGPVINHYLKRYLDWASLGFVFLLLVGFLVLRWASRLSARHRP